MATKSLSSYNQVIHDVFRDETITAISMGDGHSVALTASGRLFMWGSNAHNQLGDGTNEDFRLIPVETTALFNLTDGESITHVQLGTFHSSAITSTGNVFMWGYHRSGQLGNRTNNSTAYEKIPKRPVNITSRLNLQQGETIIQTSLGLNHSSAITSLGRLFMWGKNRDGELGDGTTKNRLTPVDITAKFKLHNGEEITLVAIAQGRSTALTTLNRLFIWGDDSSGSKPYDINSELGLNYGETILELNVELWTLYVLTSNGRLLDVDYRYGKIQSINDLSEKFTLHDGERISQISLRRFHYGVLTTMNRVFMWGDNDSGQIGDGTKEHHENPIDITERFKLLEGESIIEISLGNEHSSALTSLGRLFMWGENYNGELGDGREKNRLTPVDITNGGLPKSP